MSGSIFLKIDSTGISSNSTDTSDNFSVILNPPIVLDNKEDWSVGLVSISCWYNFYNITSTRGNNIIRYSPDSGSNWYNVTLPNGLYAIEDINTSLQQQIENNGHDVNKLTIVANYSQLKVQVYVAAGSNFQIDLQSGVSSIHDFLGFDSQIITAEGFTTAENNANITNDINNLMVHCTLVDSRFSYDNGGRSQIIYSLAPNELPGSIIIRTPTNPIYLPVTSNYIDYIGMKITDQSGNSVSFNNEHVVYILHLRKKF